MKIINIKKLSNKIKNPKPSKELIESLKEGDKILQEISDGKRKGYRNIDNLKKALEK